MTGKLYSSLFVLVMLTFQVINAVSNEEINEIKNGIKFAEKLTTSMKPLVFGEFLGTAASQALSFVSGTLKFISSILSFLGNNESPELLAIKQMYNEINRRFDSIELKLSDIVRKIDWSSVKMEYSSLEQHIKSDATFLKRIYEEPLSMKESNKDFFIHAWESHCTDCALKLYRGIMALDVGLSNNLLDTAMTTLKYNRPVMQIFMLGLFKLLMEAVNNELAYRKFKYSDENYVFNKMRWKSYLQNVTYRINSTNEKVKQQFQIQAEKDVINLSISHSSVNNENFSQIVYDFLVKKYDWRDWLVIAYRPIWGIKNHINHICEGYKRYGMYGRILAIASVDQSKSPINVTSASEIINGVSTTRTQQNCYCQPPLSSYLCGSPYCTTDTIKLNALEVYSSITGTTRDCDIYGSVGVIDSWVDLWYQGLPERLVHARTPGSNSYSVHLFG